MKNGSHKMIYVEMKNNRLINTNLKITFLFYKFCMSDSYKISKTKSGDKYQRKC